MAALASVILESFEAFVAEHRRCGGLDGGLDSGYVWLQCSCSGLIMQPASEPPKPAPAASWRATVQLKPPERYLLPIARRPPGEVSVPRSLELDGRLRRPRAPRHKPARAVPDDALGRVLNPLPVAP